MQGKYGASITASLVSIAPKTITREEDGEQQKYALHLFYVVVLHSLIACVSPFTVNVSEGDDGHD